MRTTPTREQMDYLVSIGVSREIISPARPVSVETADDTDWTPRYSGGRAVQVQWWAILFLVILALVLSLAGLAFAEEARPAENGAAPADAQENNTTVRRLDTIEVEISRLQDAVRRGVTPKQFAASRQQIETIEQGLTTLQESFHRDLASDRELASGNLQVIQARLDRLKSSMATMSTTNGQRIDGIEDLITAVTEKVDARIAEAGRVGSRHFDAEVKALRDDLAAQRKDFSRVLVLFSVITILCIGLIMIERIIMENRMCEVEQSAISRLSETAVSDGDTTEPLPVSGEGMGVAGKPDADKNLKVQPTRPKPKQLPTPLEQMKAIIAAANRFRHIRLKLELCSEPWRIGLATSKGNVRSENQDYGLCFEIGGHDVLVVADGCGGLPHGQIAAYLAALSAAVSVVRTYGMTPQWHSSHVEDIAAKAITAAAHRLAVEGDKLNINDLRGGLRTTLIVVVGNKREFGYAYIGDGGGCVISATGEVNQFLTPQKASDLALNVLAASLGPMMEGEPVTGVMERRTGDVLIVGTDGVFDRVDSIFPKDVLRGCIQYKGDLQKTAEHIVEELAFFQDSAGYVCDDNLTLGIMGDGTKPKLSQGFWSPVEDTQAAQSDPLSSGTAELKEDLS